VRRKKQPRLTERDQIEFARTLCRRDLKWLYQNILCDNNAEYQQSIGALHNLLFDFLRWEELSTAHPGILHSPLAKYIPKDATPRWIYFPVLDVVPEVADGDDHAIARDYFDGKLQKGVLIRLAGSGRIKGVYFPREHLKSEIGSKAFMLQEIIRNPSIRINCRTHTEKLAKMLVESCKDVMKGEAFQDLFGYLVPDGYREGTWSKSEIQMIAPRLGKEPTLMASSLGQDATGQHPDLLILDDVVGQENVDRQDWVKSRVRSLAAVLRAKGKLIDIGTRWAEDDAHGMFLRPPGPGERNMFKYTSWILATVKDANDHAVWPAVFNDEVIEEKWSFCQTDFFFYAQYFNNPYMVKAQKLSPDWIIYYEGTPLQLVERPPRKLSSILITIDPASTAHKDSDNTALIVQAQSEDCEYRYLLDGWRDKLDKAKLPTAIVDTCEQWQGVARKHGLDFKVGIESEGFATYLSYPLKAEQKRRGISWQWEELKVENRKKTDRIYSLAKPYQTGSILWPKTLPKIADDGREYDFVLVLRSQHTRFPHCAEHEWDALDALAHGEKLLRPLPSKAAVRGAPAEARRRDEYHRTSDDEKHAGRYMPKGRALNPRLSEQIARTIGTLGGGRAMGGRR